MASGSETPLVRHLPDGIPKGPGAAEELNILDTAGLVNLDTYLHDAFDSPSLLFGRVRWLEVACVLARWFVYSVGAMHGRQTSRLPP